MVLGGVSGQTDDASRSRVIPVWGKETGEGRDEVDTTSVLDLGSELADIGRVANQVQRVTEPLDGASSDGDGALEGVDGLSVGASAVGRGGEETVRGGNDLLAGVVEEESTGTVGVLGGSDLNTLVSDKGSLLVTDHAADGEALKGTRADLSVHLGVRNDLWEDVVLDTEELEALLVPVKGLKGHEHGSGSVGNIGQVDTTVLSTGEVVECETLNGTEEEIIVVMCFLDGGDVVEHPAELGSTEVGGERDTGLGLESIDTLVALCSELTDGGGVTGIRPCNGIDAREGLSGRSAPDTRSLSLVGQACGQVQSQSGTCGWRQSARTHQHP